MTFLDTVTPKSGHEVNCPRCGERVMIACDKRQKGQGRRHSRRDAWEPTHWTPAKEAVYAILSEDRMRWRTVRDVATIIRERKIPHVGAHGSKSEFWKNSSVQITLSTLVGDSEIEMRAPWELGYPGSGWFYRVGDKFPSERVLAQARATKEPLAQEVLPV